MVANKYQARASEISIQLVVQGGLASLLVEEKSSMDWQSLIYMQYQEESWLLQQDPLQIA